VDEKVLACHPSLRDIFNAASKRLEEKFSPEQVRAVLRGRFAAGWCDHAPSRQAESLPDQRAVNDSLAEAFLSVVAKMHPDLREAKSIIGRPVPVATVFAGAVALLEKGEGHVHDQAVKAVSLRIRNAIGDQMRRSGTEDQPHSVLA
jgi:hypothetical protein